MIIFILNIVVSLITFVVLLVALWLSRDTLQTINRLIDEEET